eukprot:gnl/MRDRNA2_/MRDRNA2_152787_c0_seq1.p1 gnl/MRDRNA2_/MRDRNA2_152787_c0~~gnl/MRDRNA2_/MRDRNA2_152787_c0_seq1.p1  ORF type:complete len:370 (-),score=74.99 gnl/MRDRNA2_/MRDRNA2_152787_c0_seq1:268-1377(-)
MLNSKFDEALQNVKKKMRNAANVYSVTSTAFHTPNDHEKSEEESLPNAGLGHPDGPQAGVTFNIATDVENDDAPSTTLPKIKVKTKKSLLRKININPKKSSDNVANTSTDSSSGDQSLLADNELVAAFLRMGITHERSMKNDQSEENACLLLHPEHPLFLVIKDFEDEYNEKTQEKQEDPAMKYKPHPMGRKHRALFKEVLMRLQQYLEEDPVAYKKIMANPEDPGPLQESLLVIKQRAADFEEDFENVICTRCYWVRYFSYETDSFLVKFIMYCRNDPHLQSALNEMVDYTDDLAPFNISFVKDEIPISADAKYCQRRLNEFYKRSKGKGKGNAEYKGKGGGKDVRGSKGGNGRKRIYGKSPPRKDGK